MLLGGAKSWRMISPFGTSGNSYASGWATDEQNPSIGTAARRNKGTPCPSAVTTKNQYCQTPLTYLRRLGFDSGSSDLDALQSNLVEIGNPKA